MNKSTLKTLIACLAVGAIAPAMADSGEANLHQVDHSKVKAMITFHAKANGIEADGLAAGLDPNLSYVSVFYDNGSKPGGPNACSPTSLGPGPVVIGHWRVNDQGMGKLDASLSNVGPAAFGTVSIRTAINPAREFLQACGKVHIN